jgi:hypothetical protein
MQASPEPGDLAPDHLAPDSRHAPGLVEPMLTTHRDELNLALYEPDCVHAEGSFEWLTDILFTQSPNQSPEMRPEEDTTGLESMPSLELPPSIAEEKAPKPKFVYHARARRQTVKPINLTTTSVCSVEGNTIVTQPCSLFSACSTALPIFDPVQIEKELELKKQREAQIAARKHLDQISMLESKQSRSRGTASMFSKTYYSQRDETWCRRRYKQLIHFGNCLTLNHKQMIQVDGFLTDDMYRCFRDLAEIACNQVFDISKTCDNSKLPFASQGFWGFALAQEAWQRTKNHQGWFAETEAQQYLLSWEHMHVIYEKLQKARTRMKEVHDNDEKELLKSNAEREIGVWRTIASHELGSTYIKMHKKMQMLNDLLKRGGDRGLHPDIIDMKMPQIMRFPKPPPELECLSNTQRLCLSNHSVWGRSSRKRTASDEASSSASAMDTESAKEPRMLQDAARAIAESSFSD